MPLRINPRRRIRANGYVTSAFCLLIIWTASISGIASAARVTAPATSNFNSNDAIARIEKKTTTVKSESSPKPAAALATPITKDQKTGGGIRYEPFQGRATGIDVFDGSGWLMRLTKGSRTVSLRGPSRTFAEGAAIVKHDIWVRLIDTPFSGNVATIDISALLADRSPDVLAVAMQYIDGAATVRSAQGQQIAGDAQYGPLDANGLRQEGSDFNDYLGQEWQYEASVDKPEADQIGALDCSGYIRMVWGYRSGVPLAPSLDGVVGALPRRAVQMFSAQTGQVVTETATRTSFNLLKPGDLLFFDASTDDGAAVDHVGMYMGTDVKGNHRFISSRKTANGPTMSDIGGSSILNGGGLYARSYVGSKRL